MSMNNNLYDFLNIPAFDAVRKLQENSALTVVRGNITYPKKPGNAKQLSLEARCFL